MKRSIFLVGLCGTALAGAGCGDDDNKTLSPDETGSEISAICQRVQVQAQRLNGEPANDAPILTEFADTFESAVQDVRDLDVAEELEETRDAFADNGEQQIAIIKEAQAIAETGDRKEYVAKVNEARPLDNESDKLASKLGATGCLS